MQEMWDIYTADGRLTGMTVPRGKDTVPEGRYHLVCEVLVRHTDGSFLCMKRDSNKNIFPGCYEATAGGSALVGEDPLTCIRRELREETGIDCERFTEIGFSIREKARALCYSYLCIVEVPKDCVILQEGETEAYRWMTPEEFAAFVQSGDMIPTQRERYDAFLRAEGFLPS